MHAANPDRSERLQRVLAVLRDRRPHSTRDLIREADVCAVNSCVAELRAHDYAITCAYQGRVAYYTLTAEPTP